MIDGFIFTIPTFDRCGSIRTVHWLNSLGVAPQSIFLQTQDYTDFENYTERYSHLCNVRHKPSKNAAQNRNSALETAFNETLGETVVMLDDDIERARFIDNGIIRHIETESDLSLVLNAMSRETGKIGAKLACVNNGEYPPADKCFVGRFGNAFFMFLDDKIRFDEKLPYGEDTELGLRLVKNNKNSVCCFSNVIMEFKCGKDGGVKGGCEKIWKDEHKRNEIEKHLHEKYGTLYYPKGSGMRAERHSHSHVFEIK